jgi:cytochrome c peroxidase
MSYLRTAMSSCYNPPGMSIMSTTPNSKPNSRHRNRRQVIARCVSHFSAIAAMIVFSVSLAAAQSGPHSTVGMNKIAKSAIQAPTIIQILLGQTPAILPGTTTFPDSTGVITSFMPLGPVSTSQFSFFDTGLTTNGRSCFTCHTPQSGWAISPPQILSAYLVSAGRSPLFQPIDAARCPDAPGATNPLTLLLTDTQLFTRGNFRISITAPNPLDPTATTTFNGSQPQWVMTVKSDPTGCENDKTYGLPNGLASVYRRPLPSANVGFLDPGIVAPGVFNIMWDAREPSLEHQFVDATEFHGQTTNAPSLSDATEGADFQFGIFTAQTLDALAGDLTGGDGSGATGGPQNLFDSRLNVKAVTPAGAVIPGLCGTPEALDGEADFCPGIFGAPNVFTDFSAFASASGQGLKVAQRESIARGEAIFNTRSFSVNDVPGLNDVQAACGPNPINNPCTATCATCHNNQNVGNDSFLDPKRTGIMDNSNNTNNALPPTPDFPLFAFYCPSGSMDFFSNPVHSSNCPGGASTCDEFDTTDPGVGLVTGQCNDLGKMKVPVLRGLASRAPYFHGGNVANLNALVNFYNTRFKIGLSAQDTTDLVNFLNTL